MSRKPRALLAFRAIALFMLLGTFLISLPSAGKVEFDGYKAYFPSGGQLNKNVLSFNLNPKVDGILANETREGSLELQIPYFLNKRYIVSSTYIPFVGERREITELFSLNKYSYEIKNTVSELSIKPVGKLREILPVILSGFFLLFIFLLTKKGIKIDKITLLPLYTTGLLLLKPSLLTTVLSLALFSIFLLETRNLKTGAGIFSLLLLTFSMVSANASFDYASISNDKVALKALERITQPEKVPEGIRYVEEESKENGKLNLVKCHQSLHELGMLTYLKFKDPVKTMAATITNCEFGYLHGSEDGISLLTTGVEESKETYKAGCRAIYTGKNDNTFLECIHGSGHAFYELYSGDYERAYKACEIWEKNINLCQVAVTMSLGDYLTSKSENKSLPELCLKIKDSKAKDSCVISAFRYILNKRENYEQDLTYAGQFCNKLSGGLKESCFFSIGDGLAYEMRNHFDEEDSNWPSSYCTFENVVNETCYMTFIRYMSYYHALFKKPVPVSYYCEKLPFKRESCETELTAQENRPAN